MLYLTSDRYSHNDNSKEML